MNIDWLLLYFVSATWMMCLMWVAQVVNYPLFLNMGGGDFRYTHKGYVFRMGFVVGPMAMLEAISAVVLMVKGLQGKAFTWSLWLLLAGWLITILFQMRYHKKLGAFGWDRRDCERLIRTNWMRVILWTARVFMIGGLL